MFTFVYKSEDEIFSLCILIIPQEYSTLHSDITATIENVVSKLGYTKMRRLVKPIKNLYGSICIAHGLMYWYIYKYRHKYSDVFIIIASF